MYASLDGLRKGSAHLAPTTSKIPPELLAQLQLEGKATQACNALAKSGQLNIQPPNVNAGMRAVIGTQEFTACQLKMQQLMRDGQSPDQAALTITEAGLAPEAGRTNYLLWGGIAAVALVGGAILLTRKK